MKAYVGVKVTPYFSRNSMRVLFFGRAGCDATEKAVTHLKTLGCVVTLFKSERRGEVLPEDVKNWVGEYIFCFRSLLVLPKYILDRAKIAAVNFHPAPVEYPGSGCLNFALYEESNFYGVTAHLMNEKVDNGAILECRRFEIFQGDSVDTLLERTHVKLLDLFFDLVADLVAGGAPALERKLASSADEKWRGEAKRISALDKLQIIPLDISEAELGRVIRATYTEKFPPYIELHGYKFVLTTPNGKV